jgi:hypothetical protein
MELFLWYSYTFLKGEKLGKIYVIICGALGKKLGNTWALGGTCWKHHLEPLRTLCEQNVGKIKFKEKFKPYHTL